jgi:hypothetical protein
MTTPQLETPTAKLVKGCIDKFDQDKQSSSIDKAILNLFEKFPENKKLDDVLLKTSVINDFYSTNIYGTFIIAKHIQQLNIDNALSAGYENVVSAIATGHGIISKRSEIIKKEINFYSFATKYCNWHNKDKYPIYDSFVEKILITYRKRDQFFEFQNNELKDFKRFKEIIATFKNYYNLTKHDFKEIDKFLWIYGKAIFSSSYT